MKRRRGRRRLQPITTDRDPDERISVTAFAREVAGVSQPTGTPLVRRTEAFPAIGQDGKCRLGDLVTYWNDTVSESGKAVTDRDRQIKELGRELTAARSAAGLEQQQLAALAGFSRAMVSDSENGRTLTSPRFWAAVDDVLGAQGAFMRRRAEIAACAETRPRVCGLRLGALQCSRAASWFITIPARPGRIELGVCEQCRPAAWELAVRLHGNRVGQLPVYAFGYHWPSGVCSCCGQSAASGMPPSCTGCTHAGCNIEQGLRRCSPAGPPPFLAAQPGSP